MFTCHIGTQLRWYHPDPSGRHRIKAGNHPRKSSSGYPATPTEASALAQSRHLLKTVFQLRKKPGRSRHGLAVRTIHSTASIKRRFIAAASTLVHCLAQAMRTSWSIGRQSHKSLHPELESNKPKVGLAHPPDRKSVRARQGSAVLRLAALDGELHAPCPIPNSKRGSNVFSRVWAVVPPGGIGPSEASGNDRRRADDQGAARVQDHQPAP